jgi:spermidine synthase
VGRIPDAIREFDLAFQIKPDYAEAHSNLGNVLLRTGRFQDAIGQYQQALRIKPNYAEVHNNLGFALSRVGKRQDATAHYAVAVQLEPNYAEAHNNLAWLLATIAPAQGGDPVQAVNFAQRACELTGYKTAAYIDTLANAYAAAGRYEDAVAMAQKAIELARSAGQLQLVGEIEAHLELFRKGQAYRQPADMSSSPGS